MGGRAGVRGRTIAVVLFVAPVLALGAWGLYAASHHPDNQNFYASSQAAVGASSLIVGALVAWHRPRHPLGWVLLAAAAASWLSAAGSVVLADMHHVTWYLRPLLLSALSGWVLARGLLQAAAPFVYPDGVGPRWYRRVSFGALLAVVLAATTCQALVYGTLDFRTFQPADWSAGVAHWLPRAFNTLVVVTIAANVGLVVRVLRFPREKRAIHLPMAVAAVMLAIPGIVSLGSQAGLWDGAPWEWLETVADIGLAVVLGWGIFRHRALGFDVVVRRTVIYACTAVLAAAAYVAVAVLVAAAITDSAGTAALVATGVVAVMLHPTRLFVERVTRRYLFGDRDDPYRVLAGLGEQLEQSRTDEDSLRLVATSVRESLRLPYVAVDVVAGEGETAVPVAESGTPTEGLRTFPIVHAGATVGGLRVATRTPNEGFSPAEAALLTDLARAAAPVARSAQLTAELRRSRELLVLAREEERRRLRRDLHDGLGPTIASVALGLDAAATRLADDPDLASLLRALDEELQAAIADIRRLVYGLRPPALDDLGLLPALRQHADALTARDGARALRVEVATPGELPVLPAAVEVAAFRIAVEGITNVVRHADASHCSVQLVPGDVLEIVVEDDGRGIDGATPGVGLASMRERAEELGGRVTISPRVPSGTVVRAVLPLAERVPT